MSNLLNLLAAADAIDHQVLVIASPVSDAKTWVAHCHTCSWHSSDELSWQAAGEARRHHQIRAMTVTMELRAQDA